MQRARRRSRGRRGRATACASSAGALTWQLAQAVSRPRLWNAKKELRSIDLELDEAQARDAALAQAQRDEPARFEAFAKRIAALDGTHPRADPAAWPR